MGASAVVLDRSALDETSDTRTLEACDGLDPERILWRVRNEGEVFAAISSSSSSAGFVFDGDDASGLSASVIEELAPGAVIVACLESMQDSNREISTGRELAAAGCRSLVLRRACVGDDEDLVYASFALRGLTSKMSSEFRIDGMTGAVNGHFGSSGGSLSRRGDVGEAQWKRRATAC